MCHVHSYMHTCIHHHTIPLPFITLHYISKFILSWCTKQQISLFTSGCFVSFLRIRKRQSPRVEATVQRAKKKVVLQDDKKTDTCVEGLKTCVFSSLLMCMNSIYTSRRCLMLRINQLKKEVGEGCWPKRSPLNKNLLEILDLISKVIQLDVMHLAR